MDHVLEHLESDHHRLLRLMYLLNRELDKFDANKGAEPSFDQILDILDYIQAYPETWHHPVEDILFTRLLAKPGINHQAVSLLLADHPRLEALGRQIFEIFSELQTASLPPSPQILRLSRQYYAKQMSHITAERSIFSLIDNLFSEADWREARQQIKALFAKSDDIPAAAEVIPYRETLTGSVSAGYPGLH